MRLPRHELLKGARDLKGLSSIIEMADNVLRTWQPCWSNFLSPLLKEESNQRLGGLSELSWREDGGYPNAERCRLLCHRSDCNSNDPAPIKGLLIEGNFLFNPISSGVMRQALINMGVRPDNLGDIWLIGDRGGQALCTLGCADAMHKRKGSIHDVEIYIEALPVENLQIPTQRIPKTLKTVEASCRIDSIASAGYGLSRGKVISKIKAGELFLNWQPVNSASKELKVGDNLKMEGKGFLEVISISITKRKRWSIEIRRW